MMPYAKLQLLASQGFDVPTCIKAAFELGRNVGHSDVVSALARDPELQRLLRVNRRLREGAEKLVETTTALMRDNP